MVLVEQSEKVISGLSREPRSLANALFRIGLLSKEKVDEIVQIPATDSQKARKIFDVILECVQHFPNRYNDLISVFKEKRILYGDLLNTLEEAYSQVGEHYVVAKL